VGRSPPPKQVEQVELHWRRQRLDEIGLELDVLDGPAISQGTAGGIRHAHQQARGVRLSVRAGPGSDLANWRGGYASRAAQFGKESPVTLCGAAVRQEAEIAADSAVGSYRAPKDGKIGHIYSNQPALFAVAVAFAIGGELAVAGWEVPLDERERYRAAEQRFFGSLTCLKKGGG
jgi:hypothetical protein